MAKNALLLHGTNGSPRSNWIPWLKNRLAWRGYDVVDPALPHPEAPNMDRYWETLKSYPFDSQTIIVGHSSGAVAALGALDRLAGNTVVDRVFCIAGFYKDEGWNCKGLFEPELDYKRIKTHARQIELWWALDDQYVSQEQTDSLAQLLHVKARIFEAGYGHFNTETNEKFEQFPELAAAIMSAGPSNL